MSNFIVTTRLCPSDHSYLSHFFGYYAKLGVTKFLINFNSRLDPPNILNEFINRVITTYSQYNLIYNIGPNDTVCSEIKNINMLKKLVKENTSDNDYIIPCDADEFHQYEFDLYECSTLMKLYNSDYIRSFTQERYKSDGTIVSITPNVDIFEQFDKYSLKLFNMPKISLIKREHYEVLGVGHHHPNLSNLENNTSLKQSPIHSRTNHFRWCIDGKIRMEKWIEFWESYPNCGGWKGPEKYKLQLLVFNDILKYV